MTAEDILIPLGLENSKPVFTPGTKELEAEIKKASSGDSVVFLQDR